MTDTIEFQAMGNHGNVAAVAVGAGWKLAGYDCNQVPLALQRKGDAVDVGEYSTLRLQLQLQSMTNRQGWENGNSDAAQLCVTLEESSDQRTWFALREFERMQEPGVQEAVVSGFRRYVRASWWFGRSAQEATISEQVAITWSLGGQAAPGAAE